LCETLDSIIPQIKDDQDVEILVSDNVSTDSTESLVADLMGRYPCIRYHRNSRNLGFDGNVIACIENANGEYITFISDDDVVPSGTFERLKHEISEHNPSIIYLNHHPFLYGNPEKRMPSFHPSEDHLFNDGKKFFLYCGLGFISALTMKTEYAMEFVNHAKHELLNQAHLGVASRVALSKRGPFIFLGTISIGGRIPSNLQDDYVTNHVINVDKLYINLSAEGLLDKTSLDLHTKAAIKQLPRKILYNKCVGNPKAVIDRKTDMSQIYGKHLMYYFNVLPLLSMPRWILRPPYLVLRSIYSLIKHVKYG
jgi:glycosyltransferase involved in cell wall biosynthesis